MYRYYSSISKAKSKIKVIEFDTEDGKEACVFFHHMKGNPHWMVAVVCYDDEVYAGLNAIRLRTGLLMLLGFLAIGLGVYFYVLAQSVIGAARTSSYYAVSPFIGVLLSLIIFREIPGVLFWIALLVMALGVYLNVTEES